MIQKKMLIFKYQDRILGEFGADEVTLKGVEYLKTTMAIQNNIGYHDIDVDTITVFEHEKSEYSVDENGLMFEAFAGCVVRVDGCKPNISLDSLDNLAMFDGMIKNGHHCNAIAFYKI